MSQHPEPHANGGQSVRVRLVGGHRIYRTGLAHLLENHNLTVVQVHTDEQSLGEALARDDAEAADVVVLVLSGAGPFASFRRIHETLSSAASSLPLVVLSERASRGQVYAALRIGAKGYVNLDADPLELVKAIQMGSTGKVYLAQDATELLVTDISTAIEPDRSVHLPTVELSRREIEVVQLLCEGLSSKEVGRHLHISPKTVENHRYNIYRKCEVDSIARLMRHAIQHGMVTI